MNSVAESISIQRRLRKTSCPRPCESFSASSGTTGLLKTAISQWPLRFQRHSVLIPKCSLRQPKKPTTDLCWLTNSAGTTVRRMLLDHEAHISSQPRPLDDSLWCPIRRTENSRSGLRQKSPITEPICRTRQGRGKSGDFHYEASLLRHVLPVGIHTTGSTHHDNRVRRCQRHDKDR